MRPASRLDGLRAYVPPARDDRLDLRLDANEGREPADVVMASLRAMEAGAIRRYPTAAPLEATLASTWGIDARRVVVTSGGDDAIDRVCGAVLEPGRAMLTHAPSFTMIEHSARLAGADVVQIDWEADDWSTASLIEASDERTSLVALVTPNNPTGSVIPTDGILEIAGSLPDALVLVDLAYVEFAREDPTSVLLGVPNVVIVRTFSKAWGLAGLRVGYAMANERVADWLRVVGGPYPVSSPSLAAAAVCLNADCSAFVDQVRSERARLIGMLQSYGVQPPASEANFVAFRRADAARIKEGMAQRGIGIRALSNPEGMLRITLPGREADFQRLVASLGEVLNGGGG